MSWSRVERLRALGLLTSATSSSLALAARGLLSAQLTYALNSWTVEAYGTNLAAMARHASME